MNKTQREISLDNGILISEDQWKGELDSTAKKFHIIGAWIAIIFDPIFAFTDYLNINAHFEDLLAIRVGVSLLTYFTLIAYRKYQFQSYWVVLVPFVLISFQNSYTFMLIDNSNILGHCMNYIALFIGGGMFILWPIQLSVAVVIFSISTTNIFFNLNENVSSEYFWIHGGLLKLVVELFMIILINFRYKLTIKEIKARLALEKSKNLLAEQKNVIESKNNQLVDSLQYAKRIQEALLGEQERISTWFKNAFIIFVPKDIVSGDFYWMYRHPTKNIKILMAADCTGHGVPAALMTVLGNSLITDVVEHREIYLPDQILNELDKNLLKSLKKKSDDFGSVNDGMDISVLSFIDNKTYFSAAKNPLIIIKNGEIEVLKGSKYPIGGSWQIEEEKSFDLHELELNRGDMLYLFSDGFQDQFGGEKSKKYMSKKFRNSLLSTAENGFEKQKELLLQIFNDWKGDHSQTDDVLVLGIEI